MPMSLKISSACRFFSESIRAVIVVVILSVLYCVRNAHNYTIITASCVILSFTATILSFTVTTENLSRNDRTDPQFANCGSIGCATSPSRAGRTMAAHRRVRSSPCFSLHSTPYRRCASGRLGTRRTAQHNIRKIAIEHFTSVSQPIANPHPRSLCNHRIVRRPVCDSYPVHSHSAPQSRRKSRPPLMGERFLLCMIVLCARNASKK